MDYMEYVKEYIIDAALLGVFVMNVVVYYKKTFTKTVLEFIAYSGALVMAKLYSEPAADLVMEKTKLFPDPSEKGSVTLIMIVVIFILISIVLKVIISYIDKWIKLPAFAKVNKALGMVLGIAIGLVITGACVALIKVLQLTGNEFLNELAGNSRIIKLYTELMAKFYPVIAELINKGV